MLTQDPFKKGGSVPRTPNSNVKTNASKSKPTGTERSITTVALKNLEAKDNPANRADKNYRMLLAKPKTERPP